MEPYREQVLQTAGRWVAFGTSQVCEALGKNSHQVSPILGWLVREGYVKRLMGTAGGHGVWGPRGWERTWALTRKGREYLA